MKMIEDQGASRDLRSDAGSALEAARLGRTVFDALNLEECIYGSGEAEKIMALSDAHQNCIRFISSTEFLTLLSSAEQTASSSPGSPITPPCSSI